MSRAVAMRKETATKPRCVMTVLINEIMLLDAPAPGKDVMASRIDMIK